MFFLTFGFSRELMKVALYENSYQQSAFSKDQGLA